MFHTEAVPISLPLRRVQLLEIAFGAPAPAIRAWHAVESGLDLSEDPVPDQDLLGLVAHRLHELDISDQRLVILDGLVRRIWYVNQRNLELALSSNRSRGRGPRPVLVGRAATVFGFLVSSGLVEIGAIEFAPRRRSIGMGVRTVDVGERQVDVPFPAEQFVEMARRSWSIDFLAAAQHPDMDWQRVIAGTPRFARRRVQAAIALTLAVADVAIPADLHQPWEISRVSGWIEVAGVRVKNLVYRAVREAVRRSRVLAGRLRRRLAPVTRSVEPDS